MRSAEEWREKLENKGAYAGEAYEILYDWRKREDEIAKELAELKSQLDLIQAKFDAVAGLVEYACKGWPDEKA